MTSQAILYLTTLVMTAGGLLILFVGKHRTPSEQLQSMCHGVVPLIAACSYLAMATGQGAVLLPITDGSAPAGATRIFYYARYVVWSFTTPLLLLPVSLTAMHNGPKRAGTILGVILADVMMIVTAFAFGASEVPAVKWTWFIVSCAAFLAVYYVIFVPQMQANAVERDDVRASYKRHAVILSVLWLIYPLILAVAPDGARLIGDTAAVLSIAVLDVVSKVAYGLMAVMSDTKATDRDLAEDPTVRTTPLRRVA